MIFLEDASLRLAWAGILAEAQVRASPLRMASQPLQYLTRAENGITVERVLKKEYDPEIMIRLFSIFLFVFTFFLGCKSNKSEDWRNVKDMIRRQYPYVSTLTTDALHTWINDTNRIAPMLIDTRSRPEFDTSHLKKAIYAESRSEIDAVTANTAKNNEIVVYCSVGFRSAKMASWLNSRGFKNVHNLEGSIFEWANKGYNIYSKGTLVNTVHPYDEDWGRLLDKNLWKTEPE